MASQFYRFAFAISVFAVALKSVADDKPIKAMNQKSHSKVANSLEAREV